MYYLGQQLILCIDCVFSRCLSNQKPLLDSGTMGTKGHTEIIVPNLTESYNSHVSVYESVCAIDYLLIFGFSLTPLSERIHRRKS